MARRQLVLLPEDCYPRDDPWRLVETRYDGRFADRAETVFALGNGYLGVRGTFEEGRPSLSPGTFISGFHETWPIMHAEEAYGLAEVGQTIVNVPDATVLALYVDDEPLFLPTARVDGYRRVLDMRDGTLARELVWSTPAGLHVRVRSRRFVSLEQRHVMAIEYEVMLLDHAAPLVISSQLLNHQDHPHPEAEHGRGLTDPRLGKVFSERVLNLSCQEQDDRRMVLGYRTTNSAMTLAVGIHHELALTARHDVARHIGTDRSEFVVSVDAEPGEPIRLVKFVTYQTSRSAPPDELVGRCLQTLDRVAREGLDTLVTAQRQNLDRFWSRADVEIEESGDDGLVQQSLRWNLFQIAQATWRAEGSGVPAKGLTGQAYEGHYFWDTEVYLLPFLCYTQPRIARNLLRFRHSQLPAARTRAGQLGMAGATYPWRTINGAEASAYYEAGTAQFHINADIAYAIRRYVMLRGDVGFLSEAGAEMLVETARMWFDLGFYGADAKFHIHGVTGPDEYTTVVDDNTYTNLMAALNLRFAAEAVGMLRRYRPDDYAAFGRSVHLDDDEPAEWEKAADAMSVPYDDERGIHPQDSAFLDHEVWDFAATPPENFPLLLHYHPLVIYRHQVLKQSDVVLAMALLPDEFTAEQKRRNFAYYDPLTTGDSSLSASVQAIIAAEIGKQDAALSYFRYALLMDLGDAEGNVSDGVHIASAGGVWMALVYGFAGVCDFDGQLRFSPRLPSSWARMRLPLRFRDRQLEVALTHDVETYRLLEGEPLTISVRGESHQLTTGEPLVVRP